MAGGGPLIAALALVLAQSARTRPRPACRSRGSRTCRSRSSRPTSRASGAPRPRAPFRDRRPRADGQDRPGAPRVPLDEPDRGPVLDRVDPGRAHPLDRPRRGPRRDRVRGRGHREAAHARGGGPRPGPRHRAAPQRHHLGHGPGGHVPRRVEGQDGRAQGRPGRARARGQGARGARARCPRPRGTCGPGPIPSSCVSGQPVALRWTSSAPLHRLEVLGLDSEEVLLARELPETSSRSSSPGWARTAGACTRSTAKASRAARPPRGSSAWWSARALPSAPTSAERKTAAITRALASASSSGMGTGVPSRIARENRSPWIVYWSHVSNVIVSTDAAREVAPVVQEDAARPVRRRVERDLDLDARRACRSICTRWYGADLRAAGEDRRGPPRTPAPPEARRSVPKRGSQLQAAGHAPRLRAEQESRRS